VQLQEHTDAIEDIRNRLHALIKQHSALAEQKTQLEMQLTAHLLPRQEALEKVGCLVPWLVGAVRWR
jgi:hypothetical protein